MKNQNGGNKIKLFKKKITNLKQFKVSQVKVKLGLS